MACKGTRVTKKEIKKMYDLYQDLGTFAKVGKKMRRHPDTVSKYIAIYESALYTANILTQK